MNEPPRWKLISEELRGWAPYLTAVVLFVFLGGYLQYAASLSIDRVDARVKIATEPYVVRIQQLESVVKESQARKEAAEATRSEQAVQIEQTPRLDITPIIRRTPNYRGVSEISLEINIKNIGQAPILIGDTRMDIYIGQASTKALDVITRVQQLAEISQELLMVNSMSQEEGRMQSLRSQWDILHEECPHGMLFWVGNSSPDIEWKAIKEYSKSAEQSLRLESKESTSQNFLYLLTESYSHHTAWYRFVFSVAMEGERKQYEMILPIAESQQNGLYGLETSHRTNTTTTAWKPLGPLLPLPRETNGSED